MIFTLALAIVFATVAIPTAVGICAERRRAASLDRFYARPSSHLRCEGFGCDSTTFRRLSADGGCCKLRCYSCGNVRIAPANCKPLPLRHQID